MTIPSVSDIRLAADSGATRLAEPAIAPKPQRDSCDGAVNDSIYVYSKETSHTVEDLMNRWAAGRASLIAYLRELSADPHWAELIRAADIDLSATTELPD